jgi:outer membrane protein OmpA-like peptidoglycan-associated protein
MKQFRIPAGIALGLLMATAPASAIASNDGRPLPPVSGDVAAAEPVTLAQAEGGGQSDEELLKKKTRQRKAAPAQKPAAAQAPAPKPKPAPAPEPAPAENPAPKPAHKAKASVKQAPAPKAPAAKQRAPKVSTAKPAPAHKAQPKPKPAPAQVEKRAPKPAPKKLAPAEQPTKAAPKPLAAEHAPKFKSPAAEQQAPKAPAAKPAPAPPKAAKLAPEPAPAAKTLESGERPAPELKPAPAGKARAQRAPAPTPKATAAEQPTQPEAAPAQPSEQPAQAGEAPAPEGQAPVLDSQKQPAAEGQQPAAKPAQAKARQAQPAKPAPPPADDSAAQQDALPAKIQPVTAEQGRRIKLKPQTAIRERPKGAEVVRKFGDRTIVQINNQIIVESNDRPRIARDAQEVYYEELPQGRIREVIVRDDGSRVVTIRDRYGDIIRRSRFMPDGREYVLGYVDESYYGRVGEWRDPGLDLPPLLLTIPMEDYILDAEYVEDPEVYYSFLDQPPVEGVERLYSIDEVRRSARIRDKVRRIDMDTINFAFGSAEIEENEIGKLEGVAQAMERLLKENPAETFLIEGHTDAVGSDVANLALSDRRAEAVAEALTNVFAIPPENLASQGYGEQYLKVNTERPERENRRVAIRRITPLVAPVASAR